MLVYACNIYIYISFIFTRMAFHPSSDARSSVDWKRAGDSIGRAVCIYILNPLIRRIARDDGIVRASSRGAPKNTLSARESHIGV